MKKKIAVVIGLIIVVSIFSKYGRTIYIPVMNTLRQIANSSDSTGDFRENVMLEYSKKFPQTDTAVAFLKNEVKKML